MQLLTICSATLGQAGRDGAWWWRPGQSARLPTRHSLTLSSSLSHTALPARAVPVLSLPCVASRC